MEEEDGESISENSSDGSESEDEGKKPTKPVVRTKYDRMFERKNQDVLSQHYTKLIEDSDHHDDEEDDFITLKRADRDLPSISLQEVKFENLSKNKMKLSNAKRKAILNAPMREKIIFGEDGVGVEAGVGEDGEKWLEKKGGMDGVVEEGKKYAESERSRMKDADVIDRAEAKEKRKEKKRKRKERERMNETGGAVFAGGDYDGYVSPEFDLPDSSDAEDEPWDSRPMKR
ncbi:hypothetical protein MPER_05546, partial [Moniliophthora perniciosa FA553]